MTSQLDLWFGTSGPPDARVALVAESWGVEEEREKRPLVGTSGTELNRMLSSAGQDRDQIFCTNLIAARPQQNETYRFFLPKDTKPPRIGGLAPGPYACEEARRLYLQLLTHPRQLVIAAGNWSLWALSQCTKAEVLREANGRKILPELQTWAPSGIMSWRGSMWYCEPRDEFLPQANTEAARRQLRATKLLPTIHPAAIMRAWYNRAPTVHDLKRRIPLALADDWRRPGVETWAPPTFAQATSMLKLWLQQADLGLITRLAADIETEPKRHVISCIGFADSPTFAMSIPFVRKVGPGQLTSYWTLDQEAELLHLIFRLFRHPHIRIDGQNFLYDTQYIHHYMGVSPVCDHDTMLAQNVLFPGVPKALEYLSSMYCRYHWYWKDDGKDWDLEKGTLEQLLEYNCIDVLRTWEIGESQRLLVQHLSMEEQMRLKMYTYEMCRRMMMRGVLTDRQRQGQLQFELSQAAHELQMELLEMVPQELVCEPTRRQDKTTIYWYSSDKQTKTLFHDVLGFDVVRHRKTGSPTTGKEAFPIFKRKYPEWSQLIDRLDTLGSVENTLQVVRTPLDHDQRLRCSYNPAGAETHRLSSSENAFGRGTNLQNLTKGEEDE